MLLLETPSKNSHKAFKILFSVSPYQTLKSISSEISQIQLHYLRLFFFFSNKKYILINAKFAQICMYKNIMKKKIEYKNVRFLEIKKKNKREDKLLYKRFYRRLSNNYLLEWCDGLACDLHIHFYWIIVLKVFNHHVRFILFVTNVLKTEKRFYCLPLVSSCAMVRFHEHEFRRS